MTEQEAQKAILERDELQQRIDAVMALKEPATSTDKWTRDSQDLNNGYRSCLRQVKELLAPKPFKVIGCALGRRTVISASYDSVADFYGSDAEQHAREFCAKLNAGEQTR